MNLRGNHKIVHFYDGLGIALARLKPIGRARGKFGTISLFQHGQLGKVFVLNGEIQHVEAWAPLYHEPLVHLSAAFVPIVKTVLVLGGGTLYAAAEALKYKSIERVVVIEQDESVINFTAKFYPHAKRCIRDKRFAVIHTDAYDYLLKPAEKCDLVINDGADLLKLGKQRRRDLLSSMTRAVTERGICADVVYRHVFERRQASKTIGALSRRFKHAISLVCLPEYHGALHLLSMWGLETSQINQNLDHPLNLEQRAWFGQPKDHCIFYNPRFLKFHLYLPPYIKRIIRLTKKGV